MKLAELRGSVWSPGFDTERKLGCLLALLRLDDLARAWDGVALLVEQRFDVEDGFDVATAVESLAGASLVWFELGKLALPEAQNIGGDVAEARDLAYAEVEFVRDVGPGGWGVSADWLVLCHAKVQEGYSPLCASIGQPERDAASTSIFLC